jgi:hypothetical protein
MPITATDIALARTFAQLMTFAVQTKQQMQNVVTTLGSQRVDADYIFRILDQMNLYITRMNGWKTTSGLDAWATSQGYATTLSADITDSATAAQACIDWVVTNFPTSAGGYLQAQTLNADGSRVLRTFTAAQTTGLVTALNSFITTIN